MEDRIAELEAQVRIADRRAEIATSLLEEVVRYLGGTALSFDFKTLVRETFAPEVYSDPATAYVLTQMEGAPEGDYVEDDEGRRDHRATLLRLRRQIVEEAKHQRSNSR